MTERREDHDGPWGVLNDWDHALWVEAEPTERVVSSCFMVSCLQYTNAHLLQGTWQFISIQLLQDIAKPHEIFDDLESFFWVLLFLAVHRFEYEGGFQMRVFDETSSAIDAVRGRVSTGGCAKRYWLDWPRLTFVSKPLQALINSFRLFHRTRQYHIERLSYGEGWDEPPQEFEAGIKKDIYVLVSYFDTVLNDSDANWTG